MLTPIEVIKKAVIESQSTHHAMLIAGNNINMIPVVFHNETDKRVKLRTLRRLAKEIVKADESWLVQESWMAKIPFPEGSSVTAERAKLPEDLADYDGRIELLICQHEIKGGENKVYLLNIVRDASGKIIELPDYSSEHTAIERNIWILNKPERLEEA